MYLNKIAINNLDAMTKYLLSTKEKYFPVEFVEEDGNKKIENVHVKQILINLFIFIILNKFKFPYRKEFFLLDDHVVMDTIYERFTNIYNYGISLNLDKRIFMNIKWDFWYMINWLNNFIMMNCQEYHKSISITDLISIHNNENINKVINTPIDETKSIKNQELQISEIRSDLINSIKELKTEDNSIRHFIDLDLIKETQLGHIFHMIGYRTDINDNVIKYLNKGNYLEGLKNPFEYVLESLVAKKALIYNKVALPDVQYFNRKQQLSIFGIKKVYNGDCGTKETTPIILTEDNYNHFIGQNIVEKGRIIPLTKNNIRSYLRKSLNMRSILTCIYSDGICEVCGGNIIKYFINPDYNVGHNGCMSFTSSTVQRVLSSKHFQVTNSMNYVIPKGLRDYFKLIKSSNKIYLKSKSDYKKLKIGFQMNDCNYIINLNEYDIRDKKSVNENNFGVFKYLSLMKNDTLILDTESLCCDNQYPKLSKDFIVYIHKNYHLLERYNKFVWIPLENFDLSEPIFNCAVINDSILRYVKRISSFLEKDIKHMSSTTEALNTLLNIIGNKSNVNVAFIMLLIKTYAVMNSIDFSNISPDTAKYYEFGSIVNINRFRSIGTSFAFERLLSTLNDPKFYLVPKDISSFDYFLCMNI